MNFPPFLLERWLITQKPLCKYYLGGSGVHPLRLRDLIDYIDFEEKLGYAPTKGSRELREGISRLYPGASEESILVTNGATEAVFLVSALLIGKGDDVVIMVPTYMQTAGIAQAIGARVRQVHLLEEDGFRANLDELNELVSSKTKMIVIVNPNNPTGSRLSEKDIRAICEIAESAGAYMLSDEIFRGLDVDDISTPSAVNIYEKAIVVAGLSKLGLPGIRIGWMVASKDIIEGCWAYRDYTTMGSSLVSERLATIAVQKENMTKIIERGRSILKNNLSILSDWIAQHDQVISWVESKSGGVCFPRYHLRINSYNFCKKLLAEEGVLLAPGDCFGSPKHFRIGYGCEENTLIKGLQKISSFFSRLCEK